MADMLCRLSQCPAEEFVLATDGRANTAQQACSRDGRGAGARIASAIMNTFTYLYVAYPRTLPLRTFELHHICCALRGRSGGPGEGTFTSLTRHHTQPPPGQHGAISHCTLYSSNSGRGGSLRADSANHPDRGSSPDHWNPLLGPSCLRVGSKLLIASFGSLQSQLLKIGPSSSVTRR